MYGSIPGAPVSMPGKAKGDSAFCCIQKELSAQVPVLTIFLASNFIMTAVQPTYSAPAPMSTMSMPITTQAAPVTYTAPTTYFVQPMQTQPSVSYTTQETQVPRTYMESVTKTIQVPKTVMEDHDIQYEVPKVEMETRTIQVTNNWH
jgi:hypothetical protein